MEEMVNKFIEEGNREHEEMEAFIREFRTTNELLFKERNNSLSELEFEVYGLSRVINKAQIIGCEAKGVTTRGGKTTTEPISHTNVANKHPIPHRNEPTTSDEAWVASGPKRQQTIAAGALVAAEGAPAADSAPVVDEGAQAIPASVQAPQPSPTSVVGLRGVVESFITEQTRVSIWMISYMTHIMDANGRIYQAFVGTLIGSSRLPYQRRVRPRTNDASTSAAPRTADQPDP
ncbi:hypothetical protein Tco_0451007 [Tanacetum coccineum]